MAMVFDRNDSGVEKQEISIRTVNTRRKLPTFKVWGASIIQMLSVYKISTLFSCAVLRFFLNNVHLPFFLQALTSASG